MDEPAIQDRMQHEVPGRRVAPGGEAVLKNAFKGKL